jgi:GNAT superfamily N-acetyltransferase
MNVKIFEKEDIPDLARLQPKDWQDITPNFIFYTSNPFCYPLKFVDNATIIAIGTVIMHREVAWLGHIIVLETHRGKGIGKMVTQHLVDKALALGASSIQLIATELGEPVYRKIGFVEHTEYYFFKDIKILSAIFEFRHIQPFNNIYLTSLLAMDAEITGENRIEHILPHLDRAFVYVLNDELLGYYLPTLGDGHIIAKHESAGLSLLRMHLNNHERLVLPKDNDVVIHFLYSLGYKECRIAKRMSFGKPVQVKYDCMYNRIGGNVG